VRRTQVLVGATGAFVTILVVLLARLNLGLPPHSATSDFLFDLYMYSVAPTMTICDIFGISYGHVWLWPIGVVLNTLLSVIVGTVIGWMLKKFKETQT